MPRTTKVAPLPASTARLPYPDQWQRWSSAERRNVIIRQRSWSKGTTPQEMEDYATELVEMLDKVLDQGEADVEERDELRQAIESNAKRKATAEEHLRDLIAERGVLVVEAVLRGVPQAEVARWADVSGSLVSAAIGTSPDKKGSSGYEKKRGGR